MTWTPNLASTSNRMVPNEEIEATPDEVADAGLCHAKQLGRFSLLQSAGSERLLDLYEKVRSNP
jgi:hypothetical protein